MADKHGVGLLSHMAVNKLVDALQHSSNRLDSFIASEIRKQSIEPLVPSKTTQTNSSSKSSQNVISKTKASVNVKPKDSCYTCPLNNDTCTHAALQMMNIRRYMMESIKQDLQPLVIRHVIARAIESRNIPLVRLVLKDRVDVLDFRALDHWLPRWMPDDNGLQISSLNISPRPPDEFDWFSRDRLGKIISMPEACELFSIIGMSQCAQSVQALCINSRRATYWACSQDLMEITADTLLQMPKLSTLILRGMADDYMLKLVGQTATGLRRLDVSGSQFITDDGIKNLFFKEITENPATYLVPSWIQKNIELMNQLIFSLETLDYSWTSVTALSRKMVQILPGSYMFKRVFAQSENGSYGHHIFIRRKAEFSYKIQSKFDEDATKFENNLQTIIGSRGSKAFIRFVEHHPWRNCILSLHAEQLNVGLNDWEIPQGALYGIITPNVDERRVHGVVNFKDEVLTELYSVYPINVNLLGETCPKLRVFRGILKDTWKMKSSILQELTSLDMFADPTTIKSILESAPNLRKIRIRVIRHILTDDHIIKSITSSMCRRTLEELWVAPGSYKSDITINNSTDQLSTTTVNNQEAYYSASNPPRLNKNIKSTNSRSTDDSATCCPIDDLVNLSIECIRTLLKFCPKLRRLGDIAWWTPITQEELEKICSELKEQNSRMSFVWENHLFPEVTEYANKSSSMF